MTEKFRTTATKSLGYETNFREWIRAHPALLKSLEKIVKTLDSTRLESLDPDDELLVDGIKIEFIKGQNQWLSQHYYCLKITVDGTPLFIKIERQKKVLPGIAKGFKEYKSTLKAKEILKNITGVEVVEPLLGYQDEQRRSYFISRWLDFPVLSDYILKLQREKKTSKYLELQDRWQRIKKLLPNFYDVMSTNMFYDPISGKIILYDLSDKTETD